MGTEDELRARIEAQIAARRADRIPPGPEHAGRRGRRAAREDAAELPFDALPGVDEVDEPDEPAEPDAGPGVPRSLEPARPWLPSEGSVADLDVGAPVPDDGVGAHAADLPGRPAARPAEAPAPPGGEEVHGPRILEPIRPWMQTLSTAPVETASGPAVTEYEPAGTAESTGEPSETPAGAAAPLAPARPWLPRASRPVPPAAAVNDSSEPAADEAAPVPTEVPEESDLIREQVEEYRAELGRLRAQLVQLSEEVGSLPPESAGPPVAAEAGTEQAAEEATSAPHDASLGAPADMGLGAPAHIGLGAPADSPAAVDRDPPPPGTDLARRLAAASMREPAVGPAGHDAPSAEGDGSGGLRAGIRRAVGWLIRSARTRAASADEEPEEGSFSDWLADAQPAGDAPFARSAPRSNRPSSADAVAEPATSREGADDTELAAAETTVIPVVQPEPPPESEPEPAPVRAEHAPVRAEQPGQHPPGVDLARRLAAASAAGPAPERTPAVGATDHTDDTGDDAQPPARRRHWPVALGGSHGGGRSAARSRTHVEQSPLVSGTAIRGTGGAKATADATPGRSTGRRTVRILTRLTVVAVIAALAIVLLRTYVVAPYYIPSASMEPTLHGCSGCNDDRVLVDKLSYRMHDINRGDVIVFHRPAAWRVSEKVLIKRVIGLPGDVLTTRQGVVYVDGLALEEPYLNAACRGGTKNLARTTVPEGEVFVMGDNRCDSADSRAFGPVEDGTVIGRAFVIIWPFGRIHWI